MLSRSSFLAVMASVAPNDEKTDESSVWPKSLLMNAAYAEAFSCIRYWKESVFCTMDFNT